MRKITRKTPDANPAASMWCEPAQSKGIWTCHKRHFVQKLKGKCRTLIPQQAFCATCAVEMHMDLSQEAFVRKFTGKMPDANPAASILCEPAQSKCIWTCHKGHLCGNVQGKCRTLIPQPAFCASLRSRNAHGHVTRGICAEIYRENAKCPGYHLD